MLLLLFNQKFVWKLYAYLFRVWFWRFCRGKFVTFSSCSKKTWGARNGSLLVSEKSTNRCFSVNSAEFTSDGFSRKDYGNRNRKQLVPAVVACANREQKQGMGLVAPRGRWRPKFCGVSRNFFLKCRSASESVFPGILDQIFRGFIDSKNVFSDAEMLKIWQIYVLGVKYLQMYVSCMSWCMWCVRWGPTGRSLGR